jgi:hypothetical protein
MYIADVESKTTDPNAQPTVLKEFAATAWVDGNNGLGPVVGNFCMQLAIQKAKAFGVGWVVAKGTHVAALPSSTGHPSNQLCPHRAHFLSTGSVSSSSEVSSSLPRSNKLYRCLLSSCNPSVRLHSNAQRWQGEQISHDVQNCLLRYTAV